MPSRAKRKVVSSAPRPPASWLWGAAALGLVLSATLAIGWLRGGGARPSRRPNVLLVTIDTLRADHLGCYGDARAATPNLDALAGRGVRFTTAVAHVPLTTPSHASILAGRIPPRHGVRDNGGFVLPDDVPVLTARFRDAGWATAGFVSGFPLDRRYGLARGFETYDDRLPRGRDPRRAPYVERPADQTTDAALAWIKGRSGRWFAWVHYFDPHAPYEPPPAFGAPRTATPYDGEIAFVDSELGRLLAGIGEAGRERLLILVTADHGESLGDHGEETHGVFVYDATLRVPLLLAGPGVPPARVVADMARLVDIAPTLLDLAGLGPLPDPDGRSLVPAVRGQALPEALAYAESLFASLHLGWAPIHALRTNHFKYVRAPRPELYALQEDPSESRDVSASRADVTRDLQARLERLLADEKPAAAASPDPAAVERLRALGYLGAPAAARRPGASGRDPKDGIALINRVEHALVLARAEPKAAIRELTAVLEQDPSLLLARRHLALARSVDGDAAGAAREIEALEKEGHAEADDLLLLGEVLRKTGHPAEAAAAIERAEKLAPGSPDATLARARALAAQGRLDDAGVQFEAALHLAPDHPEAERGLGELALLSGNTAEARARFEKILARDRGDVRTLVKLGVVAVREGRTDEALKSFQAAVALAPDDAEALLDLGGLLARLGRPADAVRYLERAVAAGAHNPTALNSLGFARLGAGDRRGAIEALRASLALDRRQPAVAEAVGRLEAGR